MDDHVTPADICTRLNLHRNTVMNLITTGAFPKAFQVGRVWRIPVADVAAYIEQRRSAAATKRAERAAA